MTHTTTNQIIRETLESKIIAAVGACPAGDMHVEYIMQSLDKHINSLLTSIQEKIRDGKKEKKRFATELFQGGANAALEEAAALIEEFKTKDI